MKLDKFLDWDGYEVVDVYVTKNKTFFLCQNDIFYLMLDMGPEDEVVGGDI